MREFCTDAWAESCVKTEQMSVFMRALGCSVQRKNCIDARAAVLSRVT